MRRGRPRFRRRKHQPYLGKETIKHGKSVRRDTARFNGIHFSPEIYVPKIDSVRRLSRFEGAKRVDTTTVVRSNTVQTVSAPDRQFRESSRVNERKIEIFGAEPTTEVRSARREPPHTSVSARPRSGEFRGRRTPLETERRHPNTVQRHNVGLRLIPVSRQCNQSRARFARRPRDYRRPGSRRFRDEKENKKKKDVMYINLFRRPFRPPLIQCVSR